MLQRELHVVIATDDVRVRDPVERGDRHGVAELAVEQLPQDEFLVPNAAVRVEDGCALHIQFVSLLLASVFDRR